MNVQYHNKTCKIKTLKKLILYKQNCEIYAMKMESCKWPVIAKGIDPFITKTKGVEC